MVKKVSVIIPAYNVEKYIERCIKSVISQTLKEIEIIVINDGSTDATLEIIRELSSIDDRIKIIDRINGGLPSVRNVGLNAAVGKYIFFLDGDDWIEKKCLEELTAFSDKFSLDIAVTNFIIDFDNGVSNVRIDLKSSEILGPEQYLNELFLVHSYPSMCNKLFKKDLFDEVRFLEHISLGEDLATMPRLAMNAKRIAKYEGAFLHYIQNGDSITKSSISKIIYQLFDAFEIIDLSLKERNISDEIIDMFNTYKLNHIINFITSEPFWDDNNYMLGFERTLQLLKVSKRIPNNIDIMKKYILKILIALPSAFLLKLIINSINFAKNVIR